MSWWVRAVVPVSNQLQRSSTLSSTYWLARLGGTQHEWTIVVSVVFALVYLWLLREAWRGRTRFALCAGLFCLSVSWLTPWYAAWPVALAAIEEDTAGALYFRIPISICFFCTRRKAKRNFSEGK